MCGATYDNMYVSTKETITCPRKQLIGKKCKKMLLLYSTETKWCEDDRHAGCTCTKQRAVELVDVGGRTEGAQWEEKPAHLIR